MEAGSFPGALGIMFLSPEWLVGQTGPSAASTNTAVPSVADEELVRRRGFASLRFGTRWPWRSWSSSPLIILQLGFRWHMLVYSTVLQRAQCTDNQC